jgi:hypothetical protein
MQIRQCIRCESGHIFLVQFGAACLENSHVKQGVQDALELQISGQKLQP